VGVSAVKSGMLGTFYAVELTREYISTYKIKNYVLDPVMVCKGNDEALNPELNQAIAEKLLPLAKVVTPNLFEAGQLSGMFPHGSGHSRRRSRSAFPSFIAHF
jgi:pyridoxine kinase